MFLTGVLPGKSLGWQQSQDSQQKATLQVATILVANMAPRILKLATLFVKKVSLNQKNWSPNGDQAKTLTWRVEKVAPPTGREQGKRNRF